MRPGHSQRAAAVVRLALSAGGLLAVTAAGHLHAEPAGSAASSVPTGGAADSAVTLVTTNHVKPGCSATFEALIHEAFEHDRGIAGDPSAEVVRPSEPNGHTYTLIVKFDRTSD